MRLDGSARWCAMLVLAGLSCGSASAAEFPGSGVGAIPDNDPAGRDISFAVSGFSQALSRVRLTIALNHGRASDLRATLTAPGGAAHLLIMGQLGQRRSGAAGGDANLGGSYVFDDQGVDIWAALAPLGTAQTLPSGHFRASTSGNLGTFHGGCSTPMNVAFGGLAGLDLNGTWTLSVTDGSAGETGSVSSASLSITDAQDEVFTDSFEPAMVGACKRAIGDFTGSGRTSYAYAHNVDGVPGGNVSWNIQDNDGTSSGAQSSFTFGTTQFYILDGDFDGDGISDAVTWRAVPSPQQFRVRRSTRPTAGPLVVDWGDAADYPVIGDYDGDGIDDFAVHRQGATDGAPSHTRIRLSRGGPDRDLITGERYAIAVSGGDYTGDGKADIAVRASDAFGAVGYRIFDGSSGALVDSYISGTEDGSSDYLVLGDVSGDGRFDINTVSYNSPLTWNTRDSATGVAQTPVVFGATTDYRLSGDFDGDGVSDYATFDRSGIPGANHFTVRPSSSPALPLVVPFGAHGDLPAIYSRTRCYCEQ